MTEPTADAWIAAWEAQAPQEELERGSAYLGEAGWAWIAAQRERAGPALGLVAEHAGLFGRYRPGGEPTDAGLMLAPTLLPARRWRANDWAFAAMSALPCSALAGGDCIV